SRKAVGHVWQQKRQLICRKPPQRLEVQQDGAAEGEVASGDQRGPYQPTVKRSLLPGAPHSCEAEQGNHRAQGDQGASRPEEKILQTKEDRAPPRQPFADPGAVKLLDVMDRRKRTAQRDLVSLHPDQWKRQAEQSEKNRTGNRCDPILVAEEQQSRK